jgi:hypothetical protein
VTTAVTIDDLMRKAADQPFEAADVDAACAEHGLTIGELFDAISRRIVRGYVSGELPFGFCDGVMNHVYSFMNLNHDMAPPAYSYSVFLAFDEGEYQHEDDPKDSSPEELYTKPMIAEILASDAQFT